METRHCSNGANTKWKQPNKVRRRTVALVFFARSMLTSKSIDNLNRWNRSEKKPLFFLHNVVSDRVSEWVDIMPYLWICYVCLVFAQSLSLIMKMCYSIVERRKKEQLSALALSHQCDTYLVHVYTQTMRNRNLTTLYSKLLLTKFPSYKKYFVLCFALNVYNTFNDSLLTLVNSVAWW